MERTESNKNFHLSIIRAIPDYHQKENITVVDGEVQPSESSSQVSDSDAPSVVDDPSDVSDVTPLV